MMTLLRLLGMFVSWPTSYEALVNRAQMKAGKCFLRHIHLSPHDVRIVCRGSGFAYHDT